MVQIAALAVAEHPGELDNAALARRQQPLAGKFRRRAQIEPLPHAGGRHLFGAEGMQVGLISG